MTDISSRHVAFVYSLDAERMHILLIPKHLLIIFYAFQLSKVNSDIYSENQKDFTSLRYSEKTFNQNFTFLLCVCFYVKLLNFIQRHLTLTKLSCIFTLHWNFNFIVYLLTLWVGEGATSG